MWGIMETENKEDGYFVFTIQQKKTENNLVTTLVNTKQDNIAPEVIIMRMEAQLMMFKKKYFDVIEKTTIEYKPGEEGEK
jgi:hypothetical protein